MAFCKRVCDGIVGTLADERIAELISPYYPAPGAALVAQLSAYLDLLLKWNARTNLTAIMSPEEIVQRHFGESLFTALHLPPARTLLDFGSGAGFPGLPIQLALPSLEVTLAESQKKKCAFLREVVRVLGVPAVVWEGRVEKMAMGMRFDVVTLRAVDKPLTSLAFARERVIEGGCLAWLTTAPEPYSSVLRTPGSARSYLCLQPHIAPRGTI